MSTQALTIRIGADASGAISVISQTTERVNQLGQAGENANRGVASLSGGVQNLGRWSGQTTSATASLTGGVSGLSRATLDAVNGTTRLNQQLAENTRVTNAAAGGFRTLKSIIGGLGLGLLANSILKVNMEMQALRTSLETVTGSANNARIAFEGIQAFASKTPYSIKEITDAFIKLKALGLSPSESALTSFGNTASAMGKSLNQMIEAVADAATGEFERLKEFGIKSSKEGENVKFTFKGVENQIKNSSEAIQGYLLKIGNTDFSGGMDRMATTTKGALSNLGDSWDAFQDHLLNSNKENAIAQWMKTAADSIGKFDVWLNGASTTIGKIQELQKEQNTLVTSILAHEKNGMIGGLIDDAVGYDVNLQKNRLQQNIKLIDELKKTLAEEQQINKTITAPPAVKGITPEIKNLIKKSAEKYNVDAALIQEIIRKETGGKFNQDAFNSGSQAAGLMQVTPIAAKQFNTSYDLVKKDAVTNIEVGTQAILRALKQSKGDIAEALARYNWGEGNVDKFIAKNHGVFDVSKIPVAETRDYINSILKLYKDAGGSDSDKGLVKFYKEQEDAAKKLAHEHEQAAKKITDNDRQLTESTAFGKYNATIDELTEAHKRFIDTQGKSGISQATYSQGIENANETLLKNTDYVQENIKLLDQQTKEYAKLVGHVGDYNSTIDELTRNKQRGAITQGEYGLGIAKANAGLMNDVAVAYPDAKIPNIKIEQATEVIDAKNSTDATKALNAQLEKSKSILDGIKTSGASAFDGLLGGISSVTSAFTSLGESLDAITKKQEENLTAYTKTLSEPAITNEQILKSTENFYSTKDALDEKSRMTELTGIRQVTGASSKMFAEQSAGRKVMHTLEMTFGAIEMALSLKKMAVNAYEAVTSQAAGGDPYSAWARAAAMMTFMAGILAAAGASMSGGGGASSSGKFVDMSPTKSTGTVLGDADANSKSIGNIVGVLNDIHAKEYPELKGINDAMKEFGRSIESFVTGIAKATNSFTDMSFGAMQLETGTTESAFSKIPIIGGLLGSKKTVEMIGQGMIIEAFNPLVDGMELGLQSFTTYKITKENLFGTKTKIQEFYGDMPKALTDELTNLFSFMGKTAMNALVSMDLIKYLGVSLPNFAIGRQKWDWNGSSNKQDYFNNMINATADRVAAVSQHIIGVFQKLGEGLYETLNRLSIQQGVVINKYRKMGVEFDGLVSKTENGATIGSLGMAALSDSLINMYNSTSDAKDGLKNFIAAMDELYELSTTKGQRTQSSIKTIEDYFTEQGFDSSKMFDATYLREMITTTTKQISESQDKAARAYEDIAALGDYVGNAFNPKTSTTITEALGTYATSNKSDWQKALGVKNLDDATIDTVPKEWQAILSTFGGIFGDVWAILQEKKTLQTEGLAGIEGKYASKEQYDTDLKTRQDALDAENAKITNLTNQNKVFNEQLNKTIPKMEGFTEQFLAIGSSDFATLERKRNKIIQDELKGFTQDLKGESVLQPVVDAMKKVGVTSEYTAEKIQRFIWSLEDTAKSIKKLADATKFLDNFRQSVKSWVQNLKATQLGSPESQYKAAADNFAQQMKIINGGLATSAEEKQVALSGITGVADTYIAAIKNNYASTKEGQDLINNVIKQVSGLTTNVDIQQLQLGVLQQIRDGVHDLPIGISDNQKTFLESLATKIDVAQKTYVESPTSQNDLAANTLAKEWTMAVNYAAKGSNFLDAFIKSFDSEKGLTKAVDLIFSDDRLNAAQAQGAIDGVLSTLSSMVNVEMDISKTAVYRAKKEIEKQIALFNPPPIFLSVDTTNAIAGIENVVKVATDAAKSISTLNAANSPNYNNVYATTQFDVKNISPSPNFSKAALAGVPLDLKIDPATYQTVEMKKFALGGISKEPAIFGEAGAEAAVPLPDGRTIPVTLYRTASNDSSVDMTETVEELKKQNENLTEIIRQTTALLKLQMAANQELVEKMNSMDQSLKTTAKKTRLQAAA